MSLAQVFAHGAETHPDTVAIHHHTHHLRYRRLHRDVESIAGHLWREGVRPGQIVGTDSSNPAAHWITLAALMRLGAVTVSVSRRHAEETAALPELSMILTGSDRTRRYRPAIRQVPIRSDWIKAPAPDPGALPSPHEARSTLGRIAFTSGSTGQPKAVLLDADRLHVRVSGTMERARIDAGSVLWCGLGPDSSYGFVTTLAAWLAGASVVFSPGGKDAFRLFADLGVNLLVASPAALTALLRDARASGLDPLAARAIVGGGRLTTTLRDRLLRRVCPDIQVSFGASETGGIAMGNSAGLDRDGGYVGTLEPGIDARILSEEGTAVAPGDAGHLWLRSPSVATSYLGGAKASAAHFRDGWFRSGDIARLSQDREITILGRSVETLNLGGVKVEAAEIDALALEFEAIEDACAVPLEPGSGEAPVAIVVSGIPPDGRVLATHIRAQFPSMPPFLLVAAPTIVRSAMGKVNRLALGQQISGVGNEPDDADATSGFKLVGTY